MIGFIYYYTEGYVGQTSDVRKRHVQHLRKHPIWRAPIILETVFGKDREDLLFNLKWQETIWMFTMHTYRRIWIHGLNKKLPESDDHTLAGRRQRCRSIRCGIPESIARLNNHQRFSASTLL